MANWYYYNEHGDKIGPIKGRELKQLAAQGVITPETWIENEEKTTLQAGQAANLVFSEAVYGMATPPPLPRPQVPLQPVAPNPFTAPAPTGPNPFTAPMPGANQVTPQIVPKPVVKRDWGPFWKSCFSILLIILLIPVVGCVAWEFYTRHQFKKATEEAILKAKGNLPLEVTSVSVTPTKWINIFANNALGEFSVKVRAKEGFYEWVNTKAALEELGITNNQAEFDQAKRKADGFPEPDRSKLRNATPTENLEDFRFHTVRVPEGKEDARTGSVTLTKSGNWQGNTSMRFPEENFIPRSRLEKADRLDDDKTKSAVNKIIQDRDKLIVLVDKTGKMIDEIKNLTAAAIRGINAELEKQTLPLEVTGIPGFRPKNWTPDDFTLPVSETFAANARTTKKLYQPVSVKEALKELGYVDNVINRIPEATFSQFKFYSSRLNDGKVALEGNIAMTQNGGSWQASKVEIRSVKPSLDNLVAESDLPPDAKTLEDKKTEDDVWNRVELIWPRVEFNQFCNGRTYNGKFNDAIIRVVFKTIAQNAAKVEGEIAFGFPNGRGGFNGPYTRSFSVSVNTKEKTEFPVTGEISNDGLPSRNAFARDFGAASWEAAIDSIKRARFLLEDYTDVNIRFTEGNMQFVIKPNGVPRVNLAQLDITGFDLDRSTVPFLVRPKSGPEPPKLGPPVIDPPPIQPIGAVHLNDQFLQGRGFNSSLETFANYGTLDLKEELGKAYEELQKDLRNGGPNAPALREEIRKVQERIKEEHKKIAQTFYYRDYSPSLSTPKYDHSNNTGSLTISCYTREFNFGATKTGAEAIVLPQDFPEVHKASVTYNNPWNRIDLDIGGSKSRIENIYSNKGDYQARVWFNNLRCRDNNGNTVPNNAWNLLPVYVDVLKVEIIKISNNVTPQPGMYGGPMIPGPGMMGPGGMGGPMGAPMGGQQLPIGPGRRQQF